MIDIVKAFLPLLGFALLTNAPAAVAGGLTDPTRPPSFDSASQNAGAGSGPVLQSVLIAPGRKEAMISGQTVKVGHKFGEARIERIAESEVVLRNGKDVQILKLFPGIDKKPVARTPSSKPPG